ncbi:hypothetical protein [Microbacterium sp. NPDC089696]|uniref:hypothetical protein n=1 Tax=Microbacterium sp. NPDC089696 TaxID=3364199 RepID=UPI00381E1CD9
MLMFSIVWTVAFWVLVLVLLLLAGALVIWTTVAVVLGVVETRRERRGRSDAESAPPADPLAIFH